MKPVYLLIVGVVVGWAASGVDWTREAVGQESPPPATDPYWNSGLAARNEAGRNPNSVVVEEHRTETNADGTQTVTRTVRRSDKPGHQSTTVSSRRTAAPQSPIQVGRYQVSAYGSPNGTGCYVVDSTTGQTWLIRNGQPPEVVTSSLLDAASNSDRHWVVPDRVPPPTTPADQSNPGVFDDLQIPQAN
jgi:hypothetical protein